MPEELGKLERPNAADFKKNRKLYYVPLVLGQLEFDEKLQDVIGRYWNEVQNHLNSLQAKLTAAKKVYHELISNSGEDGLKNIEKLNDGSFVIVKEAVSKGAEIIAVEDEALLAEFMDWGRCLSSGLQSPKVFKLCYESYAKAQEQRNAFILKTINETLKEEEAGILIMREGHHLQFPPDIQVFYVSPPALDEIRRYIREREQEMAHEHDSEHGEGKGK